ncbi:MAG: hypothetical protein R3B58_05075 [Phycisphaerales bacterium]
MIDYIEASSTIKLNPATEVNKRKIFHIVSADTTATQQKICSEAHYALSWHVLSIHFNSLRMNLQVRISASWTHEQCCVQHKQL